MQKIMFWARFEKLLYIREFVSKFLSIRGSFSIIFDVFNCSKGNCVWVIIVMSNFQTALKIGKKNPTQSKIKMRPPMMAACMP